ncbi:MAG: transcriptional regulator NrdR [Pseudobdellovibrionaceae bacterium]|jgi:transcriptional repressor NrdR
MKCPFCGHADDKVLETRIQKDSSIKRRRECLHCKSRFSTVEIILVQFPMIIKKDGRREEFQKEKLLKGLQAACQKRPISQNQIQNLVDTISSWVIQKGDNEISSGLVGKKVMAELRHLDDVAYVRFASVYRNFKHIHEFVEKLDDVELIETINENPNQLPLKHFSPEIE